MLVYLDIHDFTILAAFLPIVGHCFTFFVGKFMRLLRRGNREHCLGGIRKHHFSSR